jgi:thioredoxin-like negative regulator of GroEL
LVKEIESNRLAKIVREEHKPALALFFGDWCIDCRQFKPTWDAWTERRAGPIFTVEIMRGDPEWKDWNLEEIPTVAAFVGGAEVGRVHGTISREGLDRLWPLVSPGRA